MKILGLKDVRYLLFNLNRVLLWQLSHAWVQLDT
jgi:hypothetical protein